MNKKPSFSENTSMALGSPKFILFHCCGRKKSDTIAAETQKLVGKITRQKYSHIP
jgi:hypothetical protein